MPSATVRRWSKRTQVLTVLAVVLAAAVLTVGMVGFARSIGFVTRIGVASEALNEVGQISPDVAVGGGTNVTPAAASPTVSAAPTSPAPASPAPRPPSGGGGATASPEAAPTAAAGAGGVAGTGGEAGAAGVGGGGAAGAAAGGVGGGAGAPTYWDGVLQTMLTLMGPNTTQMCGPNTCNVGQVCCNPSCGICVAPGATCDQAACAGAARTPSAVRCGMGQCSDGQVCCNASCGICAAPGETCSTEACP